MSNSLDSDQARCFVRPDQSQNSLQRLSADDTSRQRINPSQTEYFYAVRDCGISGHTHFLAHLSRKLMGEPI